MTLSNSEFNIALHYFLLVTLSAGRYFHCFVSLNTDIIILFSDVTLITGICANASTCMAQCTNLTRQLVEAQESDVPSHYYFYFNGASGDGGLFWLRFYEFTIR